MVGRGRRAAWLGEGGRGGAGVGGGGVGGLKQGGGAGGGIDVGRGGAWPRQHPCGTAGGLWRTGHSAGPTSPAAMVRLFVENVRAYGSGQALRGEVDFARGY